MTLKEDGFHNFTIRQNIKLTFVESLTSRLVRIKLLEHIEHKLFKKELDPCLNLIKMSHVTCLSVRPLL